MINAPEKAYAVLKLHSFQEHIKAHGIELVWPKDSARWFIPVFDNRSEAIESAGGDASLVAEVAPRDT